MIDPREREPDEEVVEDDGLDFDVIDPGPEDFADDDLADLAADDYERGLDARAARRGWA